MVLLISYDLNGHERPSAYEAIKKKIEEIADDAIRPLYSQWIVETSSSPDEWAEHLKASRTVDKNDRLFITQVERPYQGWLSKSQWVWLNERV